MFLGLGFLGESSWWDIHMQTGLLLLPGSVSWSPIHWRVIEFLALLGGLLHVGKMLAWVTYPSAAGLWKGFLFDTNVLTWEINLRRRNWDCVGRTSKFWWLFPLLLHFFLLTMNSKSRLRTVLDALTLEVAEPPNDCPWVGHRKHPICHNRVCWQRSSTPSNLLWGIRFLYTSFNSSKDAEKT